MIIEGEPERGRTRNQKGAARPEWQVYEQEVAELVESLDSGTTVEYDRRVQGRISGVARQLDAFVQGQLAKQTVWIAIEAKRYRRSVSIGTVDEFIGKMLDVGCDRGVLYSAGGFTEGALSRAGHARNPAVGCVHIAPRTVGRVFCPSGELTPLELAREEHLDRIIGTHAGIRRVAHRPRRAALPALRLTDQASACRRPAV